MYKRDLSSAFTYCLHLLSSSTLSTNMRNNILGDDEDEEKIILTHSHRLKSNTFWSL